MGMMLTETVFLRSDILSCQQHPLATHTKAQTIYGSYVGSTAAGMYCTSVLQNNILTEQYSYDIMNRETSHTDGVGNITTKTYDATGKIACITHPDGERSNIHIAL